MIPDMIAYLLKLSFSLAVVFLFYRLVLQHLTFYTWNRWYLLIFTTLSFIIPLVDVSDLWQGNLQAPLPVVTHYIPPVEAIASANLAQPAAASPGFDPWDLLLGVILSGIGVLLVKLAAQFLSFIRIRQQARLISDQGIKIYQVDANILPFSFGRSVFLNQALHRQQDLTEIIRHELVHVQQGHTVDVVWMELICLLNWFNPFAWLLRRQLRQNLEYLADSQVLESGIDKKHYQYLLLQVTDGIAFRLAQPFNFSSLKNRIVMMNKMPSSRPQLARFLFLLPLVAIMLLAFRSVEKPARLNKPEAANPDYFGINVQEAVVQKENKAAPKQNKVAQKQSKVAQKQSKAAQKQNKVAQKQNQIHRQENQALTQINQTQQIRKRGPAISSLQDTTKATPFSGFVPMAKRPAKVTMPEDYQNFMQRNPQVKGLQWQQDNHTQMVIIHLKSGKQEIFDLKDKASLAALEQQYGKLPAPPPPPPAPPVPQRVLPALPAPKRVPPPPPVPPVGEKLPADGQKPAPPAAPAIPEKPAPPSLGCGGRGKQTNYFTYLG